MHVLKSESNNGADIRLKTIKPLLGESEVAPRHIQPLIPWENGNVVSFNSKLRVELPNRKQIDTVGEARVILSRAVTAITPGDPIAHWVTDSPALEVKTLAIMPLTLTEAR